MDNTKFLELARKRQSVRHYQDRAIDREKLGLCLEAARIAPSACNSQPWEFVVIDRPELLEEFGKNVFSAQYSTNAFAKGSPCIVAVVADKGSFIARVGGLLRDTRYYLIDIGIAAEHFILQAAELGIGSCWLGWFNVKEANRILSVGTGKSVEILISLGYPDEKEREKSRKKLPEMSRYA